jgi:hypothetical protein
MLLKISECFLCGRYFRTGLIREVTKKELLTGVKKSYDESKVLVCVECLKHIEGKQGLNRLSSTASYFGDIIDGDTLGAEEEDVYKVVSEKKERKPRVSKKITESPLAKAMKGSTSEVVVDGEEEPKKRGRKPKLYPTVEETEALKEPKKRGRKPKIIVATEEGKEGGIILPTSFETNEAQDVVIPTSMPSLKEPETVELREPELASANKPKFVNRTDGSSVNREVLKSSVREAFNDNPEIMYSVIAEKLGVTEDLVRQLSDEIGVE